jgi:hypothetical protein
MTELVVEFSASAYMTDTQLSRLKRIPHLKAERPIGDILQGMVRQGLVVRQGYRKGGRYVDMRIGPRRA